MNLQKVKDYLAVLSLCNGLLIAFLLSNQYILLYISLGISFISIIIPITAHYLDVATKKILKAITMVLFTIFATVFYFILLTLLGLIKRLFQKSSPFDNHDKTSFYIDSNKTYSSESFEKMG